MTEPKGLLAISFNSLISDLNSFTSNVRSLIACIIGLISSVYRKACEESESSLSAKHHIPTSPFPLLSNDALTSWAINP